MLRPLLLSVLAVTLLSPVAALAGKSQTHFERTETRKDWVFDVAWKDAAGERHTVHYALPRDAMDEDRAEPTYLKRRELNTFVVDEVVAWGKGIKGVKVTATIEDGGVRIGVSGSDRKKAKETLEAAEAVRDKAVDRWLRKNRFFTMASGSISFDHARLVNDYAEALEPVAEALKADTKGKRAYVARALSFVQSIPYEARKRKGGDPGYRRPLALLFRNRGDCDSKAVLFLGLVRAAYPKTDLAVVYIPGHALTGVGLPPRDGDEAFVLDDTTFVFAEPVGPALHPLGTPAPENKKDTRKAEIRVVP